MGEIRVKIRRFIQDPKGDIIINGIKGHYELESDKKTLNLLTTLGVNFLATQGYSDSLANNGANYMALTTDDTAPDASDTTLTGEITTGGLSRKQASISITDNIVTLTALWTATVTHTNVQKAGLFTASSAGTMVNEGLLDGSYTLNLGDQIEVEWTITVA